MRRPGLWVVYTSREFGEDSVGHLLAVSAIDVTPVSKRLGHRADVLPCVCPEEGVMPFLSW